jgi:hypothetical protein
VAVYSLAELLKGMSPRLSGGKYFIATVDESRLMELAGYLDYIVGIFREDEGLTIVLSDEIKEDVGGLAEKEMAGPFALITLTVQSDLMAVGFLAKITAALAKEKISVNAFSAYYHDHLLVPYGKKDDAMRALKALSKSAGKI